MSWGRLLVSCVLVAPIAAQGLVFAGASPGTESVGDADGDGRPDSVLRGGSTFLVRSGATQTFLGHLLRPWTSGSRYVFAGDHDGDGCEDLVWEVPSLPIDVVSGRTGAVLSTLPVGRYLGSLDFDVDGFLDIMHVDETPPGPPYQQIVRSGRTGAVLYQVALNSNSLSFSNMLPAGDVNGDGYEDIGFSNFSYFASQRTLSIALGPSVTTFLQLGSSGALVGDVNGDGSVDLARANPLQIEDAGGNVLWSVAAASFATAEDAGDMDGDGLDDLIVHDSAYAVHSAATHAPMSGAQPGGFVTRIGDFDGDGRSELAATSAALPAFIQLLEWVDAARPLAARTAARGAAGTTSIGHRPCLEVRGHCGLGHTVIFDVRGGMPGGISLIAYGSGADLDLAPFGAAGNRAYVAAPEFVWLAADPNGLAIWHAPLPNLPALLGTTVSVQAIAVDAAANALGVVTSGAVDCRLF